MRIVHSWTDLSATIGVEGLTQPVRVLHVADTHMALIDDRDAEHVATCRGRSNRFGHRHQNRDAQGKPITPEKAFTDMMVAASSQALDLIALTGDIIDFPSQANVGGVIAGVEIAGAPMLYTAGNHDWIFPTVDGTAPPAILREAWLPALAWLHAGQADYSIRDISGVRFLAVDDSTYQISEDQLEFTRKGLAAGLPTIILTHIPLSLPTLRDPTIEKMQSPILLGDPDWPLADRRRLGIGEDAPATLEFVRLVANAENLVAILCGHIHFPHVDAVSLQAVQYVTAPGYAGEYRLVELRPL